MPDDRRIDIWKMTSIGLVVAAIVAVVTGIVVANRTGPTEPKMVAPSASPPTVSDPSVAQSTAPSATATTEPPATSRPSASTSASKGVPPQSVIAECNRVAGSMSGPERARNEKVFNTAKDAGVGALGGAAAGAIAGAIADGGKGAGKGALIGGGVGAGAGTLYGIYDNKKHDERYRSAYVGCMKSKGYTA